VLKLYCTGYKTTLIGYVAGYAADYVFSYVAD
jgi:hypothetical protein